jgi:hypothetical protein
MNEETNVMTNSAMSFQTPTSEQSTKTVDGIFPYHSESFESQYARFRAAMDQLRESAVILDGFDLRVNLKWKKDPAKPLPPADKIKFPEVPRYVSDEVSKMVLREEYRQSPDYQRRIQEVKTRKHPEPSQGYTR